MEGRGGGAHDVTGMEKKYNASLSLGEVLIKQPHGQRKVTNYG